MTSEEQARFLNPDPVPPSATSAPSPMDLMMLQSQQAQARADLSGQQRVSDAILQATQPQAASAWRGRRGSRFAAPSSPAAGLTGIGASMSKLMNAYQHQQAQDALRDQQQQAMLRLSPMPPSASVATSDPANHMQDPDLFRSFGG